MKRGPNDYDEQRRQILRRATAYTWGFLGAGVLVALGGSALVAWLLTRRGLPFVTTWLIIVAIVVLPSLLGLVVRAVRDQTKRKSKGSDRDPDGEEADSWPKTER